MRSLLAAVLVLGLAAPALAQINRGPGSCEVGPASVIVSGDLPRVTVRTIHPATVSHAAQRPKRRLKRILVVLGVLAVVGIACPDCAGG
jgi:hypothetical protein